MKTNEIISPYLEHGVFAGVRVNLGDEDFVIAPNDYQNGKRMSWSEAMGALKADNISTWNYRQICLTMAYRKEVDKALKDNGGEGLDNCYWTCAEYSAYGSFFYYGNNGSLDYYNKYYPYSVRPIKNLKK